MNKQHPLRLRTCISCGRNFFSRSSKSQYCCIAHQVKEWRARNKASQEQLAAEFHAQKSEHHGEAA